MTDAKRTFQIASCSSNGVCTLYQVTPQTDVRLVEQKKDGK